MSRKLEISLLVIFLVFIFSFFILFFLVSDRFFSENENRVLQQFPELTTKTLFKDGTFTMDFETYVTDQFPFRDIWVMSKTPIDFVLLKQENNGVFRAKDGYLLEKFTKIDEELIQRQVEALNKFISYHDNVKIYFSLIPTSSWILRDKLPEFAENVNQNEYISKFYGLLSDNYSTINLIDTLENVKNDYIFYKTDHHWTSFGAYNVFIKLCDEMNMVKKEISNYEIIQLSDKFFGTLYSKGNFNVKPDEIDRYDLINFTNNIIVADIVSDNIIDSVLYNDEFLNKKDKYSYFLNGNPAYTKISGGSGTKTLCILKDSFMHSLVPFLVPNYEVVYLLDVRYLNTNINNIINEINPDEILIMYNAKTFSEDVSISKLGLAPKISE